MEILLVAARLSYVERMLKAMNNMGAQNLSFFSEPVTLERQCAYLERMRKSDTDFLFLVFDKETCVLLGTVGLHEYDRYNKSARLGVLIFNPSLRRNGIGSEAVRLALEYGFAELGLNKIYAKCFATNHKMQMFLLKLGFGMEAILEKEYLLRGEYHDMVRMVIFGEGFLKGGQE